AQGVALKQWSWPGASHPSRPCPGVLWGNPAHPVPRAIFLLQEGPAWHVGKFVPDPHRQQILHREKELLDLAAHHGGHAPRCLGWKPCGSGGALWTEWLATREDNPSTTDRLEILHDWLLPKPPRPLSDFSAWKISSAWPEASAAEVQAASKIQLRPCLRHGDFAPWNLLQRADGAWVAVDWEEGCAEDAPGLDLIHDLLQEEFLIQRSSPAEAKANIGAALQKPPYAKYLTACGWSGHERILLDWALGLETRSRTEINLWIQCR
ncbi:MAG: phosphotransferase, partial [Verrucomicrobiota bacterium]